MDKIKKITETITGINKEFVEKAKQGLDNLTKPQGSLGRLEELAMQICGITEKEKPLLRNKVIFTLASDHGVAEEGVSAYPKEVTAQMVYNFLRGGAGINVLARHIGARVIVVDMGVAEKIKIKNAKLKTFFKDRKVNFGTKNMARGPAMSRFEAVKSIETGIAVFKEEFKNGIDIIGTGDMGIGNTTPSSAIAAVFTKKSIEDVVGRGTGIDDKGLENKIKIIKKALKINTPSYSDPIDVLAKVGGFEIGGLAGIILSAAAKRVPIVIDGFISGAAALIAYQLEPKTRDYMIASHCSAEKGHRFILEHIGLKPLLDLNLRLGEGTGAALAINLVEASIRILTQMATFKGAGVSERTHK
ncbi:MAG: nicotinate-nucleotide--dimethylbenzimidazole phosphoribosyltransferase [Candidatus Omnitrophota bacterium]|nr:nicotinate-nucleotide--dimethylbenzimidazole phosphoribosyltransferase [Candidatus Omnitrophota bacterium]